MIKHLRYFLAPFFTMLAIFAILKGDYYPLMFILVFDISIGLADLILKQDKNFFENPNPFILNAALYINLPLLYILSSLALFVLTNMNPPWFISIWEYIGVNLLSVQSNITFADKIVLIFYLIPLFIATKGTNVGHELTHRKRKKFDMFVGNWLLALSWDCTFAIEHVYGHHKNVGLKDDPATAKRGESLYIFIVRSTIKAHKDAWKIEIERLKRQLKSPFSFNNKMIQGYMRSLTLCLAAFLIGSYNGVIIFIIWSLIAKSFLETINYIEHYGLVRVPGEPVLPKHSWNSNHVASLSLLYNLNRHSAHHEKANKKYWELNAYPNAPNLPYGYLICLYLAYFTPPLFKKMMKSNLEDWDKNYASDAERKIIKGIVHEK